MGRLAFLVHMELQVHCSARGALTNDGLLWQAHEETMMNTLFTKEVYLRLSEDKSAFVCTTRWGRLFSKMTEFALKFQRIPETVDEKAPVPSKRRSSALDL